MLIPTFRNEAEASACAEQYKPMRTVMERPGYAMDPAYARQYGVKAARAAALCHAAAVAGDQVRLRLYSFALSLSVNPPVPRQA